MQKENGNNIYNSLKLSQLLEDARNLYNNNKIDGSCELLKSAQIILKKANSINEVLTNEIICLDLFDSNLLKNNTDRIANKLVACRTAVKENNFFMNDKQGYLQDFIDSKIKDIIKDSAFEKATKEIILYLGNEKRNCLMNEDIYKFFDVRQDNIRDITQAFKKARIAFLEKHIPQGKQISRQRDKGRQFER